MKQQQQQALPEVAVLSRRIGIRRVKCTCPVCGRFSRMHHVRLVPHDDEPGGVLYGTCRYRKCGAEFTVMPKLSVFSWLRLKMTAPLGDQEE